MSPKRTQKFWSQFIWPKTCWSPEPQSTAFSDLIFTIKKWQNSKNKVTSITEPKKTLVSTSGVILAIWARFEGEISIKNDRKLFWMLKFKLKVEPSNKPFNVPTCATVIRNLTYRFKPWLHNRLYSPLQASPLPAVAILSFQCSDECQRRAVATVHMWHDAVAAAVVATEIPIAMYCRTIHCITTTAVALGCQP